MVNSTTISEETIGQHPVEDKLCCSKCIPCPTRSDSYQSPLELLSDPSICVKVCAPMVRYSKLPFRLLVRQYGCDIAFSPMIVADPFSRSEKARQAEFSTSTGDRPLIVQFGAANAVEFSEAVKFVANVCDGVDLNCGCPQRWVCKKGFGSCLINKPELVADMVKHVRRLPIENSSDFTVSIKIRIHDDLKKTVNLVQTAERAGVSFISVHGRTVKQRKEPPNLDAIALVKDSVSVPVIANGGVKSLADVHRVHEATGVDGVMAAEGLLDNPAMFLPNCTETPPECVKDYIEFFSMHGTRFNTFHHHLMLMLQRWHQKPVRKIFNALSSFEDVTQFLRSNHACFNDVVFPEFCDVVDELELIP